MFEIYVTAIVSVPQKIEKSTNTAKDVTSDVSPSTDQEVASRIKELEIFDLEKNNSTFYKDSTSTSKLDEPYIRLAAVILFYLFRSTLKFIGLCCSSAYHMKFDSNLSNKEIMIRIYEVLLQDAAQMDMATKCLRTLLPRQQRNIISLFDNLRTPPKYSEFLNSLSV